MSSKETEKSAFAFFRGEEGQKMDRVMGSQDGVSLACGGSVRFAEVPDQLAWKRRERLVSIFGPVDFREISSSSVEGIVQHNEAFDVIICSVDDVARLRGAVRSPADVIIKKKVAFAYSEKTSPGRRTQLLKLGFDDVLSSSMSNEEIRLRFESIVERSRLYNELSEAPDEGEWQAFVEGHVVGSLRRRQKDIVQALVHAKGNVVKYRDIASYDYASDEYNISSLKATVSNIRKKLVGCDIVSVHGEGYRLVVRVREAA